MHKKVVNVDKHTQEEKDQIKFLGEILVKSSDHDPSTQKEGFHQRQVN